MRDFEKQHIILLTTWYPPRHSIAVNRMLAFAKYLDKGRFDVDVITLLTDEKMEQDVVIEGVTVHRLQNNTLFKRAKFDKPVCYIFHKIKALYNVVLAFFVKREYHDWQKRAEKKVFSLLKEYGLGTTVISSYEPIEPHLVAISLKKQGLCFNWIADCRDEITQNYSVTKSLRKLYAKAEQQMLRYADVVTSVSQPILEGFESNVPEGSSHIPLFAEIRNGYDFEEMADGHKNGIFTIIYTGTFYSNIKPYTFFKALQVFLSSNTEAKLRVNLVGVGKTVLVPHNLESVVYTFAKVPHNEALLKMQNSDCLLLILPKQNRKGVYSGKLFEYLGCRKPILAVVDPDDVAAELIKQCNAGYVADFDDVQSIKQGIEEMYNLWKNGERLKMNEPLIRAHHRKAQVAKLNELITNTFYKS